jgi:hypothetical protein
MLWSLANTRCTSGERQEVGKHGVENFGRERESSAWKEGNQV